MQFNLGKKQLFSNKGVTKSNLILEKQKKKKKKNSEI